MHRHHPLFAFMRSSALLCLLTLPLSAANGPRDAGTILAREAARLQTDTLANGLQILLKPDASAPVISVQIWIHSGSIHEAPFAGSGVAHAVEHMIFKGTTNMPPGALSRQIQDAGGRVNAYTTFDRTVYYADLPAHNWQVAFDLLAEAIFAPALAASEWQSEREVIRREIAMGADQPARVLSRHLWQSALRVSPYRHPVIGYTDTFLQLTREDLVAFHRRHYAPDNATIVIAGNMDAARIRQHIQETLGDLRRPLREPLVLPEEPRQVAPRYTRYTDDVQLTRLGILWNVPAYPHPDTAALHVLARIAGSGRTSRLQQALVESSGHFLQVSAWHFNRGFFGVSGLFEPGQEPESLAALQTQLTDLRTGTFLEAEVARAVRMMLTDTLQSFTTMSGQAAHYGHYQHLAGDPTLDTWWAEQLAAVTPADVQRVARKWLDPAYRTQTILAPQDTATTNTTAAETATPAAGPLERYTLDNGVVLLVRPAPRLPFVYMAAALQGGLLSENPAEAGITSLMADLLTRGTTTRTSHEISLAIESRGASLSAFSGFNAFGITAKGLQEDTDLLLTLLRDCLLHPVFPQDEFERQQTRQLAALRNRQDEPMSLAMDHFRASLFDSHPYRYPPAGALDTVSSLTREDLQDHHQRLTTASNLVLAVFGDVDSKDIRRKITAAFADMPRRSPPEIRAEPVRRTNAQRTVHTAEQEQAIILVGVPGIDILDPDHEALAILQTAMSGLASNLAKEIRETRGLAYFTGATQQVGLHPGFFAVYAGTAPASIDIVEKLLRQELARVREQGLTADEQQRAVARMIAQHQMSLQNQRQLAMQSALHERYGLGAASVFSLPERLQAVTAKDIQRAAQRLLDPEQMVITILRPPEPPAPEQAQRSNRAISSVKSRRASTQLF